MSQRAGEIKKEEKRLASEQIFIIESLKKIKTQRKNLKSELEYIERKRKELLQQTHSKPTVRIPVVDVVGQRATRASTSQTGVTTGAKKPGEAPNAPKPRAVVKRTAEKVNTSKKGSARKKNANKK